jgi:hypothetical protein
MNASALGPAYDHAIERLHAAGGDLAALPEELRTLLMVESAQSIIDNGGLEFFYDTDFPNNPSYAEFVAAYRRIGADAAADSIEASALLFPFDEPHYFAPLRQLWLERFKQDPQHAFARLDAQVCGDASVWTRLAAYVREHRAAFVPTDAAP